MRTFLYTILTSLAMLFSANTISMADVVPSALTMEASKASVSYRPASVHLVPMPTDLAPSLPDDFALWRMTACAEVGKRLPAPSAIPAETILQAQELLDHQQVPFLAEELQIPEACIQHAVRFEQGNDWETDVVILAPEGDLVLIEDGDPRAVRWSNISESGLNYYAVYWMLDEFTTVLVGIAQ